MGIAVYECRQAWRVGSFYCETRYFDNDIPLVLATYGGGAMIQYRAGYKYQLAEEYSYDTGFEVAEDINLGFVILQSNGNLVMKNGYAWDGPSGPALDTPSFMRASLVHDALYQLIRSGKLSMDHRNKADRILREISLQDGMSCARAWYSYYAVKLFARKAAERASAKDVITAP